MALVSMNRPIQFEASNSPRTDFSGRDANSFSGRDADFLPADLRGMFTYKGKPSTGAGLLVGEHLQ